MKGSEADAARTARPGGRGWRRAVTGPAVVILLAGPGAGTPEVAAQETGVIPPPTVAVVGGWFNRDQFHGEGPSTVGGLRMRLPLGRYVLLEPGVSYTSFRPDTVGLPGASSADLQLLFLDFQIQLQIPVSRFRPYVGVGGGGAVDFRDERGSDPFLLSSISGSLGLAVDLGSRFEALGEARIRTLDDFDRTALVGVVGIGWRP